MDEKIKLTIRIKESIYDRLSIVAKENKTSINKIVSLVLEKYINEPKEINYIKKLDEYLKEINNNLERISKRQYLHFEISKQQFANFGYLSNANIRTDKCLNEIINRKDSFND